MFTLKSAKSPIVGLLLVASLHGQAAAAKDAFGLDQYKLSADKITHPKKPYTTKFGNPINVYDITPNNADQKKKNPTLRFLIQGGLHGNELLASEFVGWLAKRFAAGESLLNTLNQGNIAIDFIPYANPDGTILFTRYNSNQINLNRNFGVLWGMTRENPGPSAFSENESRAIGDLIVNRKYTAAIDVHGYVNWVVIPTAPNSGVKGLPAISKEQQKMYEQWSFAVKREAAKQLPGYEVKTAGELGDGGAFEDFAWWKGGTPAACLELFTESRHVLFSFASTIMSLLTPKILSPNERPQARQGDTFIAYENYIHSLFSEAIRIKTGSDSIKDVVSSGN